MQIHQLKPRNRRKSKKRIGRGGKKGTYSGRGVKGQRSRAGRKFQPITRDLIKRYPKLRGYRFSSSSKDLAIVNLSLIQARFKEDEKVSPQSLLDKGLIRKIKGGVPVVKILAKGEVKKKFTIEGCLVSKSAMEKIKKAGGRVEEIKRLRD